MAPRAIFIGMPGAGKSAVGKRVAAHFGLEFKDSDELIVQRTSLTISEMFARDENEFRRLEAEVIAQALTDFDGILSLGGGAVMHPDTQRLLAGHTVFLIEVDDEELVRRVTKSRNPRPLLADDPAGSIARLRSERMATYHRIASHVVYSDQRGVRNVVDAVIRKLNNPVRTIAVSADRPYKVTIGFDLVGSIVHELANVSKVLMVHAPDVSGYVGRVAEELTSAGIDHIAMELPRGEEAKTAAVVEEAWRIAGEGRIGRDGAVLAIGGGATTDVGGFIAATWLRGVRLVQVPTTLLAMVDAAVGGKTGINTATGKNLVGSFYEPSAVICDIETLTTLSRADIVAGLGEVIKCGFIADPQILRLLDEYGNEACDPAGQILPELIARAVQVKADVVSQDLHESGLREILNYGHTLAHAIEVGEHYRRRHGEAVAIGCVFAAALAETHGLAPSGHTELHRRYFSAVGLPVDYPSGDRERLVDSMYSDKKVRDGKLRFVVVTDVGQPTILNNPDSLAEAFAAIGIR